MSNVSTLRRVGILWIVASAPLAFREINDLWLPYRALSFWSVLVAGSWYLGLVFVFWRGTSVWMLAFTVVIAVAMLILNLGMWILVSGSPHGKPPLGELYPLLAVVTIGLTVASIRLAFQPELWQRRESGVIQPGKDESPLIDGPLPKD